MEVECVAVAEDEDAEAVPLGFEEPVAGGGDGVGALGEHGEDRRLEGEGHADLDADAGLGGGVLVEEGDEEVEAAVGGEGEGGFGLVVLEGGVGAVVEEGAGYGEVAFDGSEHEEGPAVLVDGVGVEAGGRAEFEGGAEGGGVATLDEVLCCAVGQGNSMG